MRVFRLTAGVTKLEGVRNEYVRGSLGITDIEIVYPVNSREGKSRSK